MPKLFDHAARERLLDAIANNEIDELRALVEEDYPVASYVVNEHGNTALGYAIMDGEIDEEDVELHFQMIQYLIDIGSDLNAIVNNKIGARPIHAALGNLNIDPRIVELLYQANPSTIDSYAIGLAEAHQNQAELLTIIGRPDLIDEPAVDPLAAARAHFNTPGQREITAGLDRIAFNLHEINYEQELGNIFKNLPTPNMDEQKKFDQMIFDLEHPLLKGISFYPTDFGSVSESSISIFVISKEAIEEAIGKLLGMFECYLPSSSE